MSIDLKRLAEPFPADDIEWRVSHAKLKSGGGISCKCLAYITARAIQSRLDEVCGPENWRNEQPVMIPMTEMKNAFACGISIRIGDEWVTKWDVSDPTQIEGTKGGWSSAMKRTGANWGIGRYLYNLTEAWAETQTDKQTGRGWNYATLKDKVTVYFWKPPSLPAWALPKEKEHEVSKSQLTELKDKWRVKFIPKCENPKEIHEGFVLFVRGICGEFPVSDVSCWLKVNLVKCWDRIQATGDPNGPSADVPFEDTPSKEGESDG